VVAVSAAGPILQVAVPSPLRRLFDYLPPAGADPGLLLPGIRVQVPFGRTRPVGVLVAVAAASEVPPGRLRRALALLDRTPVVPPVLLELAAWAASYYHHPPGEVLQTLLPVLLRQGAEARVGGVPCWRLTVSGRAVAPEGLTRAPRQAELLRRLGEAAGGELTPDDLPEATDWRAVLRTLVDKGWVERGERPCLEAAAVGRDTPPALNPAQAAAVAAVGEAAGRFQPLLLDGVTGSGKTEVYLQAIATALAAGRQALVLVPEIGLTPQTVARFRRRFAVPLAVLHSGLGERERLCAWLAAGRGEAPIVIGTRSAVFTPLARPGLIIVDEEHDASFKQQEGFRYSARDLALVRGRLERVPVVLGSATPSLESLRNAGEGRYRRLALPERAGAALHPRFRLLDIRAAALDEGLSQPLLAAMGGHLDAGGQVLLFLNRRGFAPTLICHGCGWVAECARCDARLTLHARAGRLRCHHCGAEQPVLRQCPACGGLDLRPLGQGTERVEEGLGRHFPGVGVVRVDRDSTRRKGAMERLIDGVQAGASRILVGTQMLAKGHHFPGVTLVGILDVDGGLFSADFRAGERMAQLVIQVAGRAGRADRPGEVVIQTRQPDHPLLIDLIEGGYDRFARAALAERAAAGLPPYTSLALVRAEAPGGMARPLAFLESVAERARALAVAGVQVLGPVSAPMERRAGRYRAQLLLIAPRRADLHALLGPLALELEGMQSGRAVRWSLDVDPLETF
jgi:primosomal protein N' (replication factor Y)